MVQKDLERVGIPYVTPDGIADFHAAGRHTYITELNRNGVSLAEAKELARHSDVRMTMRYTHVGLDQARAIRKLSVNCQWMGVSGRRSVAAGGTIPRSPETTQPRSWQGLASIVPSCHRMAESGG